MAMAAAAIGGSPPRDNVERRRSVKFRGALGGPGV